MMMARGFSVCESNYPIAAAVSPIIHIHHPKTHTIGACSVHAIYLSTSFVVNFEQATLHILCQVVLQMKPVVGLLLAMKVKATNKKRDSHRLKIESLPDRL